METATSIELSVELPARVVVKPLLVGAGRSKPLGGDLTTASSFFSCLSQEKSPSTLRERNEKKQEKIPQRKKKRKKGRG